jgi:thymidylate synthase
MLKRALEKIKINDDGEIHDENQYISLINDILNYGTMVNGRNGNTLTVFGSAMHFNLENNVMPILTTKRVAWKTCAKELFWFLKGSTDNTLLQKNKVNIWNDNASRDFLDSRNLHHLEENDLGPVYGHQWRFFNADYTTCHDDYTGKGVDQLQYIINCLKDPVERYSRRLVMSAWNPQQIDEMALPPCHVLAQFNVIGNELSCSLYQRSGDVGLGVPFNIASYSFLTHILAKHCGLIAKEFVYYLGNAHIYDDHIEMLKEQVKRKPLQFPTINIQNIHDTIEEYSLDDIVISDYNSHDTIKMVMRK